MVDQDPSSSLKRRPAESLRPVRRVKTSLNSRTEVDNVPGKELAPSSKLDRSSEITAEIQSALSKTGDWVRRMSCWPLPLFWVAVSRPHMMAQLYWQCRLLFNRRGVDGHVEPEKVVKGLARWLRPLLREMSEKIYGFLMSTGLQLVVEAYLDLLNRASRLGLFFSNDFATEKEFDPRIDSEEKKGLLRAGDTCIVVFPATITPLGIVVSKRFVVATQPPEQLESLRQKMLRSPAATRNGGLDTSWSPGKKPFDAREAIQRDMAEGDTANAAPGDAQSKGSGLPEFTSTSHDELTSHELESLVRDVDGLEETVPRTSDASVAVEGSSQSKSTGPGQEVGGPGSSFEHYAAPDAVRLKEPETHWRMSYPEFVPISARNT